MMDRAILKALLDTILKQMRTSIKDADLTKDYEVYSTKEFVIDYSSKKVEVTYINKAVRDDEWLLTKIAASAIYAIGQRVELESKIDPKLVALAARAPHTNAVSTRVKTKWGVSISRNEGYWSMNIAVASDAGAGEIPVMVLTWRLCKEKKGD